MITEDYISFETAKLLKEKGFNKDAYTMSMYDENGEAKDVLLLKEGEEPVLRPTLQMAMKWLREEKDVQIVISPYNIPNKTWSYYLSKNFEVLTQHFYSFITYEEACEAGIRYILENLI